MQFNGILIGSDDAARLIEYYTKVLGEPGYTDSSFSTWMLGSGSVSIGPHSEVHGRNPQPGRFPAAVMHHNADENVLRLCLRILHKNVKIAVFIEDARI